MVDKFSWTYCSSDLLWGQYITTGISSPNARRVDKHGHEVLHPTPSKSSPGDCNFIVTQYPKAPQFDNLPDKDSRTISGLADAGLPGLPETIVLAGSENTEIQRIPITEGNIEGAEILVLTESSTSESMPPLIIDSTPRVVAIIPVNTEGETETAGPIDAQQVSVAQYLHSIVASTQVLQEEPDQRPTEFQTTLHIPIKKTAEHPPIEPQNLDQNDFNMKRTDDSDNSETPYFEQNKSGVSYHLLADPGDVAPKNEKQRPHEPDSRDTHIPESNYQNPKNEKHQVEHEAVEPPKNTEDVDAKSQGSPNKDSATTDQNELKPEQKEHECFSDTVSEDPKAGVSKQGLEKLCRGTRSMKRKQVYNVDDDDVSCEVCGKEYNRARDNRKYGRWVACENLEECGTWAERKCLK